MDWNCPVWVKKKYLVSVSLLFNWRLWSGDNLGAYFSLCATQCGLEKQNRGQHLPGDCVTDNPGDADWSGSYVWQYNGDIPWITFRCKI